MKPVVVLVPEPQTVDRIFAPATLARLHDRFTVVEPTDEDELDRALPHAWAIIGQPNLPRERLDRAPLLTALLNVEGNFYPNVDYATCFARGVKVLGCGPAYAQAVAEHALGLALDLARGITREDRAFRAGRERYLGAGNDDAVLLRHADVGFLGYGNLGRALRPLLAPFSPTLRVYDPWLPEAILREVDVLPAGLEDTLRLSRFVFVLAAVTDANQALLDGPRLDLLMPGARLVLVSRAAIADYEALAERLAEGRFLAAIDVWPTEPVPAGSPFRSLEGAVLSAHRAGGIPAAFTAIGEMVVDDLELLAAGLPPVRMQPAAPELVARYRNRPAS